MVKKRVQDGFSEIQRDVYFRAFKGPENDFFLFK